MSPDEIPEARRLGFRERRKLGITIRNMARVARELKMEGEPVTAEAIAAGLIDQKVEEFMVAADRDWASFLDALIAFIEKLLPLIQIFMGFM